MVEWDSKERGFAISEESGTEGLYLACGACRHTVRMRWVDVVKTWRVGTYTREIARSLRCSICGERQGYIMAWVDSRPKDCRGGSDSSSYPIIGAVEAQRRLL